MPKTRIGLLLPHCSREPDAARTMNVWSSGPSYSKNTYPTPSHAAPVSAVMVGASTGAVTSGKASMHSLDGHSQDS